VAEKGFLAPLLVEEPKERSKMKKAFWRGKNQGNEKRTSKVERLT
jgi:hypothetical protein